MPRPKTKGPTIQFRLPLDIDAKLRELSKGDPTGYIQRLIERHVKANT